MEKGRLLPPVSPTGPPALSVSLIHVFHPVLAHLQPPLRLHLSLLYRCPRRYAIVIWKKIIPDPLILHSAKKKKKSYSMCFISKSFNNQNLIFGVLALCETGHQFHAPLVYCVAFTAGHIFQSALWANQEKKGKKKRSLFNSCRQPFTAGTLW